MTPTKSLTDRTLNGLLWIFSGTVAQSALSFVILIVLARLLTPTEFGIVNAALIVVGVSQIFSQLGIGPAIVQHPNLSAVHIHNGFTLSILIGIAVGIFVALVAPLIAQFFRMAELKQVIEVLALVFPLTGLSVVCQAVLQREMQFRKLAIIQFSSYALGYGLVGVILAFTGWGVWALVYAQLGQALVNTIILMSVKRQIIGFAINKTEIGELLNFGTGLSLAQIANYLALQGDNLVVGRLLGVEALGVYGRAYHFLAMPANLLGNIADKTLFPAMASIQDDKQRLGHAYQRVVAIIAMVTLPLSGLLIALAPEIILLVLGPQWTDAIAPFQMLAVVLFFRTGYRISDSLVRATGAVYRSAWRKVIYAGSVITGAWIGHFWGLLGVAAGVGLAIILQFLLMFQLSVSLTTASWTTLSKTLLRHSTVAILVGGSAWSVKALLGNYNLYIGYTLLISGAVAIGVIAIMGAVYHDLFGEEGAWIGLLIGRHRQTIHNRLFASQQSPEP